MVVKGGNEGVIGLEERKDEALPVSKRVQCVQCVYNVYNVCTMCTMCVQCVQCAHTYSTHNVYVQQRPQQSVKQFKSVERSIVWGRLAFKNCFTAIITSFEG